MKLYQRKLIEINTDPQRRCYDGCHFSSEIVWTAWGALCDVTPENAERRLKFFTELNDYAVSQRGEVGTRCEFKIE